MYTGRVGRALFRVGWYRNSVEGPVRIGVTRNWFGHGEVLPGAVWGGGISADTEGKQLAFLRDSAANAAAKERILAGIGAGKVTFDHTPPDQVRPVLEGLKADPALGALATAAYDKLFPEPERKPEPPTFETVQIGDRSTLKIKPNSANVVSHKLLSVVLAEEQSVYGRSFPEGTQVWFRHDSRREETSGVRKVKLGKPQALATGTSELKEGAEVWFEETTGRIEWIRLAQEQEINDQIGDGNLKATVPVGAWLFPRLDHQLVEIKMLECQPHGAIVGGREGLEELGWAVGRSEKENDPKRTINEDSFLLVRNESGDLLIVADGMGGHAKGEAASSRAIQAIYSALTLREVNLRIPQAIEFAAVVVDEDKTAAGESVDHGRGSTIVAAETHEDRLDLGHVGDSRCYAVKKDGRVTLLTLDHSLVIDVLKNKQSTLSAPLSGDDLAQFERDVVDPDKVPAHLAANINRAIGRDNHLPDISHADLEAGDWTLLCSDGLTGAIPQLSELLAQLRKDGKTPEEAMAILFDEARRLKPDQRDNITIVIREHGREVKPKPAEVTLTARIDDTIERYDFAGIVDLCTQIALGQLKPKDDEEAISLSGTLGKLAMRGRLSRSEELQGSAEAAQAFLLAPEEEKV